MRKMSAVNIFLVTRLYLCQRNNIFMRNHLYSIYAYISYNYIKILRDISPNIYRLVSDHEEYGQISKGTIRNILNAIFRILSM